MAESNKSERERSQSSSSGVDTDKFETPRQSDNDSDVNVKKLMLGGAYEQLDEDARENLGRVQDDINVDVFERDSSSDEAEFRGGGAPGEERKARHDSSDDDVQTNIDDMLMYTVREENGESVRVLKFTHLFLPDTEKRRRQMERFNLKKMGVYEDHENEQIRKRKRELKESQKRL